MAISGINKVAVVGAGVMGNGIAQLFAMNGYQVNLIDIKEDILKAAIDKIDWSLGKLVEKKLITPTVAEQAASSIHTYTSMEEGVKDVDLVVESVPEDIELKRKVFKELSNKVPTDIIIATNTSNLRINSLADAVTNPARFVGMHFLNPPPLMPMVEVVMGEQTSEETAQRAKAISDEMGKLTVLLKKDRDLAEVLLALSLETFWQLDDGDNTREEIDASFRKEGFPMGVLELADYGGLDTVTNVIKEKGLELPGVLGKLIKAGNYGKKTGRGFYDWSEGRPSIPRDQAGKYDVIASMAPAVNEAITFVEEGVCSCEDMDQAFEKGQAFPFGPFRFADMRGIDAIVQALESSPRQYEPHPRLLEMVEAGHLGKKSGKGFYDYRAEKSTYENIIVETDKDSGVSTITINRPARLNALNLEAIDEFIRALDELIDMGKTRCLVIRGKKPAFCVGADLTDDFLDPKNILKNLVTTRRIRSLGDKVEAFPTPVIAAIDGYALGGGCELALASDTRIASERSEIGLPEVTLGALPGAGGTQRTIRLLGLSRAKDMVMRGRRLSAGEAFEIGLVNELSTDDEFEEKVNEVAMEYASGPPVALAVIKAVMNSGAEAPLASALEMESFGISLLAYTEDIRAGIDAMMAKKKPDFKGR